MTIRTHTAPDKKRTAILEAALKLFGQYGYRRTSIEDIAHEAEIAKGTVYLSFKSKEDVFRALCESLLEKVQTAAEAARAQPGALEDRLFAILDAKFGLFFETVYRSAHAAELMDSKNRLSADQFTLANRKYARVIRETLDRAVAHREIDLAPLSLNAAEATELILAAAHGVEHAATAPAAYHRRLRELVRVMVAGLRGGASTTAPPPA